MWKKLNKKLKNYTFIYKKMGRNFNFFPFYF